VQSAAEQSLLRYADEGVEFVLLLRAGAFLEFDLGDFLPSHRDSQQAFTRLSDKLGPLDGWVIDAARLRQSGMLGVASPRRRIISFRYPRSAQTERPAQMGQDGTLLAKS
jgi:hypothetical protein